MKIVVLAGGLSPERNVSLASGGMVANSLINSGHQVLLLDLFLGIEDISNIDKLFKKKGDNLYDYQVEDKIPNNKCQENIKNKSLIGPNVIEICKSADIVYMALHGDIGENGKIQGLFDVLGIKYTGSNHEGCVLSMNKLIAKKIVKSDGVLTPDFIYYNKDIDINDIFLPCVVKPSNLGSSIGVSIVNTKEELKHAIDEALKWDNEVLIEKFIKGREFSSGIIDGHVLPAIEIIPKEGFYDYKNKYKVGRTQEICPALITDEESNTLKELTKKVCKSLNITKYARVDFILGSDNNFYFLEANTLPGMTKTSLLPQEAVADNMNYEMLLEKIISL